MEFNLVRNLKMREIGNEKFGLDHLRITRLQALQKFTHSSQVTDTPSYACKFCSRGDSDHLALAYEDGCVHFRHAMDEAAKNVGIFRQIHKNAIFDICWVHGEHKLLTASGDETTILLDVTGGGAVVTRVFRGHAASVRRVAACPSSPSLFATGGRDGKIIMWDARSIAPEDTIIGAHRSSSIQIQSSSVMDLKYIDMNHLISCGNADNSIKVWDIRKTHSISRKPMPSFTLDNPTKTKMFLDIVTDPNGSQFYASSSCNKIYQYKYFTAEPEGWYEGANVNSGFVRTSVSPDGEYLLSGSLDNHAYIWPTKRNSKKCVQPLVKLVGHTDVVTAVTWATAGDTPLIITCSDDNQELLWRMAYDNPKNLELDEVGKAETLSYPTSKPKFLASKLTAVPSLMHAHENTPAKVVPTLERATPLLTMTTPQPQTPSQCRQLFLEDHDGNCSDSSPAPFLQNLPNFNIDGVSPHNLASPQQANHKENIDWLTQMRKHCGSEEKPRVQKSSGKKHPNVSNSGKKRKGKSLLQYFPKILKSDSG